MAADRCRTADAERRQPAATSTARTAAVSSLSAPPAPPRLSTSRSAIAASARRSASTSRLETSSTNWSAARGGIRSVFLTCAARLAGRERLGDRERVAQPADHVVDQAGDALALLAQLEQQPRGGLAVAGHQRVGERPDLALGRARAGLLDLLGAELAPGAVLQRELLQLPQQPLLAVADLGDQRLRAVACRASSSSAAGLLGAPTSAGRQALTVDLGGDLPADRLDRLVQLRRAP